MFAGLTTMAGFVSLLTSQVFPVKYFGLFSAFGVLSSLMLTMLLIPAGVMLFGAGGKRTGMDVSAAHETGSAGSFGGRFADMVTRHPVPVITTSVLIVALSLLGISMVWINTSFLANFEKSSDIVKTDALKALYDYREGRGKLAAMKFVFEDPTGNGEVMNSKVCADWTKRIDKCFSDYRDGKNQGLEPFFRKSDNA